MAHLSDGNETPSLIIFVPAAIGVGIGIFRCIITVYEGPSAMLVKREILLRIQDERYPALCEGECFLVKRENNARAAGANLPFAPDPLIEFSRSIGGYVCFPLNYMTLTPHGQAASSFWRKQNLS